MRLLQVTGLFDRQPGQVLVIIDTAQPGGEGFGRDAVAGSFYLRQLASQMRTIANPQWLFYETQKIRVRASRLLEGLERAIGTRSGPGLQVELRGVQELTDVIGSASRRNAIGFAAATAIIGTAVTASARNPRTWLTATAHPHGAPPRRRNTPRHPGRQVRRAPHSRSRYSCPRLGPAVIRWRRRRRIYAGGVSRWLPRECPPCLSPGGQRRAGRRTQGAGELAEPLVS